METLAASSVGAFGAALHPSQIAPTPDASARVRQILDALTESVTLIDSIRIRLLWSGGFGITKPSLHQLSSALASNVSVVAGGKALVDRRRDPIVGRPHRPVHHRHAA